MHEYLPKLIPELPQWNNGRGIDALSWIECIGRFDHAAGYAALFWPDFFLYDGCIFWRAPSPENYQQWMKQCGGNRQDVEVMLNHLHIADLFMSSEFKPTNEIIVHLGRALKEMWSCKLKRDFPDMQTRVEFCEEDSDDLLDYQITFFQVRESPSR